MERIEARLRGGGASGGAHPIGEVGQVEVEEGVDGIRRRRRTARRNPELLNANAKPTKHDKRVTW